MSQSVKPLFKSISITSLLLLIVFASISCQSTVFRNFQLNSKATPFKLIQHQHPGITKPQISWEYYQPEHNMLISSIQNQPLFDYKGNLYFIDVRNTLTSINQKGQVRWKIKGFRNTKNQFSLAKEGVIVGGDRNNKIYLISSNGNILWSKEFNWLSSFFLTPQGMLMILADNQIILMDAKRNILWKVPIEEEMFFFDKYFFDMNGNSYLFFFVIENEKNVNYLLSISPQGLLRWKKMLSQDRSLIKDFIPSNHIIQDTYLLAYFEDVTDPVNTIEESARSKVIIAYGTDGQVLWQKHETRTGILRNSYVVTQNNHFIITFHEFDKDSSVPSVLQSHISYWNKEGELQWISTLQGRVVSSPSLDDYDRIYLGLYKEKNSYLYSLDEKGNKLWSIDVEYFQDLAHPPLIDPSGGIVLTVSDTTLLYYVKNIE